MSTWKAQKALLEKELQHNRGYLLVSLILLIYGPVIKSLYYLWQGGKAADEWGRELTYILNFQQWPAGPPPISNNTMIILGIAVSILLGALLLGEERKGSLSYLVTTPISRPAIVLSKFFAGCAALLLAMGINTLFLISQSGALGIDVSSFLILRWALITSLGLVAMFTLALLASTLTAGVLPAAGLGFLLMYIPGVLVAMVEQTGARYFQASELFSIKAEYLANYLTITDYLNGEHWSIIEHVTHHDPNWRLYSVSGMAGPAPRIVLETYPLLLAILFLLGLSILVFQLTSLEEQGSFFASPAIRRVFIGLGGLLISYLMIFPLCSTFVLFLCSTTIVIIAIFGLGEYLHRHIRR